MENQKTEIKQEKRKFNGSDEDAWQYIYDLGQAINSIKLVLQSNEALFYDIDSRLKRLEAQK